VHPIRRNHLVDRIDRRQFIAIGGMALAARALGANVLGTNQGRSLETPYKLNKLVLIASGVPGTYDALTVDCPFVFQHEGLWHMTFVAYDGTGYQTGLATSTDLVHWTKKGCILKRDPTSAVARYNIALNWILRENALDAPGRLKQVGGRFIGAYHAYPNEGLEQGAAIIGLAYSHDLYHWTLGQPALIPQDGAAWEHGGLYKPCLLESNGDYYLFYNAKNMTEGGWHEQTGVAISKDLKTWKRYANNPIIPNGGPGSPDEHFASDPCVLQSGKDWAFFYFGLDAKGVARDLVATGPDLFHATKYPHPLVDVGAPGSVDSEYAHKPSIVSHKGELYHFYCAVGKSNGTVIRGISVASSRPWA
jgi:predicted GH43/DUF377 family glycosyl hydrolase